MSAGYSRSGGVAQRGQHADSLSITDHARKRWAERASGADADIETALRQALPIAAPARDCATARLYAPCDVVFVVSDWTVTTVCPANYDSLETSHLGECGQCGCLEEFRGPQSVCHWCGSRPNEIRMDGGLTVSYAGER